MPVKEKKISRMTTHAVKYSSHIKRSFVPIKASKKGENRKLDRLPSRLREHPQKLQTLAMIFIRTGQKGLN